MDLLSIYLEGILALLLIQIGLGHLLVHHLAVVLVRGIGSQTLISLIRRAPRALIRTEVHALVAIRLVGGLFDHHFLEITRPELASVLLLKLLLLLL